MALMSAAGHRDHDRLGQELHDDVAAAGACGFTNPDLLGALRHGREQHVHDAEDVVKEELDEKDLAAVSGGFAPQPEPPAPVLVNSPIGPAKAVVPITGALITGTNKPGL
jgi:bacteriocin-like protein